MVRLACPNNFQQWLELAEKSAYQATLLAKKFDVSPRQLRRYTQASFGRSPQDWLNEQRLVRAAKMLKRMRTVKTVASQLGFKQLSHFSREFKLQYGVPPTKYLVWSDGQSGVDLRKTNVRAR
jgi:AraC-like DNA-binding protein